MRALLVTLGLALSLPLAVACAEDDGAATPAAGAGGAAGQGGAGGDGLSPKITPTSDAACPSAPPDSGGPCARGDDSSVCAYDATDCQRFDARCRGGVWTVLVARETGCIQRPCPATVPDDGEACQESSTVGTNDCRFNKPDCGDSRRAVCDGTKWTVGTAPDQPSCRLTCPETAPAAGAKCVGYALNGCSYDNDCGQRYVAQCSGGVWVSQQGRATCTTSDCPEALPAAGDSCLAYEPQLSCTFSGSCGVVRIARCNIDTWVVNNPCGD